MIKNLEIKNFKSIKHLELDCKKINLFIGEPNTGKSNILEALGILSFNLYDENLDDEIEIRADEGVFEIKFGGGSFRGGYYENGLRHLSFDYDYEGHGSAGYTQDLHESGLMQAYVDYEYYGENRAIYFGSPSSIKFYKFAVRRDYPRNESDFLLPPFGDNLLSVLMTHKDLKKMAARIFEPYGLRIVFKPHEGKIDILKFREDVFISHPYALASDTLQRIIFYLTAIGSNKNSVLIFEEPESNSFPYHTKHLGKRIAFDETNQYFIATHNPYLLLSNHEKAHKGEVAVFVTYFEDYQTKVKCLTDEQLSEFMDGGYDPFFNLDSFIEEE